MSQGHSVGDRFPAPEGTSHPGVTIQPQRRTKPRVFGKPRVQVNKSAPEPTTQRRARPIPSPPRRFASGDMALKTAPSRPQSFQKQISPRHGETDFRTLRVWMRHQKRSQGAQQTLPSGQALRHRQGSPFKASLRPNRIVPISQWRPQNDLGPPDKVCRRRICPAPSGLQHPYWLPFEGLQLPLTPQSRIQIRPNRRCDFKPKLTQLTGER